MIYTSFKRSLESILPERAIELYRRYKIRRIESFSKGPMSDLTNAEWHSILAFLKEIERSKDDVRYLEVGIWKGGTIKFLMENTSKVEFTGVDLFEDFRAADDNTHISSTFSITDVYNFLGPGVELIKADVAEALPELARGNRKFDFIFIDGNHTYDATKKDFENCTKLIDSGGFIGFHNCSVHIPPDYLYVHKDGGPWKVTQEVRRMKEFSLELEVDRIRIFQYLGNHHDTCIVIS